jgi:hypothetical protein
MSGQTPVRRANLDYYLAPIQLAGRRMFDGAGCGTRMSTAVDREQAAE